MFAYGRLPLGLLCLAAVFALWIPPVHAQQQFTITVQAYEVSRDDAAALLAAQPAKIDAVNMVQTLSAMSAKQASRILKLGSAAGPAAARMKGSDADGGFEASVRQATGSSHVDLLISATCAGGGAGVTTAVAIPASGFAFIGAIEQGASGKVVMVFARSS